MEVKDRPAPKRPKLKETIVVAEDECEFFLIFVRSFLNLFLAAVATKVVRKRGPGPSKPPPVTLGVSGGGFGEKVPPSGTFIEQFAEKEGTLKDTIQIGDKITDLYRQSFNKAELRYGDNFCAYCSGTPSHPAHQCPARSAKVRFLLKSTFSLALNVISRLSVLAGLAFVRGLSVLSLDCPPSAIRATNP